MDAVELPYPVDVAPASICKLMGSDGFGRAVAKLKEVGHCDLDRDRIVSNGWCSSSHGDKDEAIAVNASESLFQGKRAAIDSFRCTDQLPSFSSEELSQNSLTRDRKAFLHSRPQESNLQKCKSGRVSHSVGKFSKRPRISQAEETSRVSDACEIRDLADKYLAKSASLDGNQLGRQKNAATKRSEKRSSKIPMKAKFDSFPMKSGSAAPNASSSTNALGSYGLKTDIQDFTKLVEDLSLNDILEGSCQCPSRGKEKVKKAAYPNDNIMQSVRKACTLLQPLRPGKSQNPAELDNSRDQTIASPFLSCMAVEQSGVDDNSRDPCTTNVSSLHEVPRRKSEPAIDHDESTLYSPKDLLEKLSLPSPKDLESLLIDASKPISASKSAPELRIGKQVAKRGGMPSFPWSHAFNGHFRSNPDAVKMPAGRGSFCPGKWARMKNPTNLLGSPSDRFTNLDSITYDQSLVPETKVAAAESSLVRSVKWNLSSSSAACSFVSGEQNAEIDDQQEADRSCSVLGAARTLCDMAACSSRKTKLHKRPPMRSRLKPEPSIRPSLISGHTGDDTDKTFFTKKPKLSPADKCFSKAPVTWSAPKSSRTCLPPTSRLQSVSSSSSLLMKQRSENHQKQRKPVLPDWNRGGRDGFR